MEPLRLLPVNPDCPDRSVLERLKAAAAEKFGQINDPQGIAQIRLIRAELQHSLFIANHRVGSLRHLKAFRRKPLKGGCQHLLSHPEHILLGGKAHLKIKLIKFPRRAVRPGVLIPETRGNLKIFIHPRYHKKLLILLRRLREGIKFPFIVPGRHNIIPCSFRGGCAQNRSLHLHKSHFRHFLPQESNYL